MKIPILDYESGVEDLKGSGNFLLDAMREPGFIFLKNIPGYAEKLLKQHTVWFFNQLSPGERMDCRMNPYRGFVAADEKAESSYKELFEIGGLDRDRTKEFPILDATPWPKNKEFQSFMRGNYNLMVEIGTNLIKMLAVATGADVEKWLEIFLPNEFSTMRLIHYPRRQGETPKALMDGSTPLHCGAHQDTSFVTLLSTFQQPGLEMLDRKNNQWFPIAAEEDWLVVNIGGLMVHLCGEGVKATEHRVVDHGVERYSVPFFFEPNWDVEVETGTEREVFGRLAMKQRAEYFEHRNLKTILEQTINVSV